jgi:hypothetical protein
MLAVVAFPTRFSRLGVARRYEKTKTKGDCANRQTYLFKKIHTLLPCLKNKFIAFAMRDAMPIKNYRLAVNLFVRSRFFWHGMCEKTLKVRPLHQIADKLKPLNLLNMLVSEAVRMKSF